jgi:hypothetical protein
MMALNRNYKQINLNAIRLITEAKKSYSSTTVGKNGIQFAALAN